MDFDQMLSLLSALGDFGDLFSGVGDLFSGMADVEGSVSSLS